jgi:hypothetical protein
MTLRSVPIPWIGLENNNPFGDWHFGTLMIDSFAELEIPDDDQISP